MKNRPVEISNLSLVVTDDCNFNCSYCYQKKEKKYMSQSTIEKAIAFFYPYLKEEAEIIFWGGEPLLAFDNIKYAVNLLQEKNKQEKKKIKFYLTSNGSLVSEDKLVFFDRHGFDLMLSFDGLTQDTARKAGSSKRMPGLIKQIQKYPGIVFSVNSVFTPETVGYLSGSLRFIIELGVPEILVSLSSIHPWDQKALDMLTKEYERLVEYLFSYYKETGNIPVNDFKIPEGPPRKGFVCLAGQNRMSVTMDEDIWGCYLFHDYMKQNKDSDDYRHYHFGKLDDFIKNHESRYPEVLSNYSDLKQDMFFTEREHCFLCSDVEKCSTCPVNAAFSTALIGKIPPWLCDLNRIQGQAKERFLSRIKHQCPVTPRLSAV
jgi:sulfatase maturation enzyme AslB (radical SAM superfamily)